MEKRTRYNDLEQVNGAVANALMDELEAYEKLRSEIQSNDWSLCPNCALVEKKLERLVDADALRRDKLEEVGWNRYRVLINSLKDSGNKEIAEDLRLLVRFASAAHQYLGRTKELDYVVAAFMDLPLAPHGTHF